MKSNQNIADNDVSILFSYFHRYQLHTYTLQFFRNLKNKHKPKRKIISETYFQMEMRKIC